MIPAFRSLDRASEAGDPLPSVWTTLTSADITFRRGELAMIAGPPGGGKSTLGLQYVLRAGVSALCVVCDSNSYETSAKFAAILRREPLKEVKSKGKEVIRNELVRGASHLWLAHESGPDLARIDTLIEAAIEVRGAPPEALVVDNLKDIGGIAGERHQRDQEAADILKRMAVRYEMAVIALAHTMVPKSKVGYPQPMAELKGQVSEDAALIITVAGDPATGVMRLAAVKNRHGLPSPDASKYVELDFDGPSGVLSDPRPKPTLTTAPGYRPWENGTSPHG